MRSWISLLLTLLLVACGGGGGAGGGTAGGAGDSTTGAAGGGTTGGAGGGTTGGAGGGTTGAAGGGTTGGAGGGATGGAGGGTTGGAGGGAATDVRLQAVLGPLVGSTVEVFLLADRGDPTASPIFATTTRDGATLAAAGTFEIPRNRLENDEPYVIYITGGIDVDPDDDGVREPPGQEIALGGTIHALATGADLLAMAGFFRVNALTEVAYQVVLSAIPEDIELSAGFVTSRLDRVAAVQLVAADRGGDLNGDGRVDRFDLAHFRPAEDGDQLVLEEARFRELTEQLREDALSGRGIALLGTTFEPPPTMSAGYPLGTFAPYDQFEQVCEQPRGAPWFDQSGTIGDEKNWLRSWSHDLYLWFDEIIDADPEVPATRSTAEYYELMRTFATTASGRPRDRFHFARPTRSFLAFLQSGLTPGYGAEFTVISATPPREVRVAYTYPHTPAADAGIQRGDEITAVDGVDVRNGNTPADAETIAAVLFSPQSGFSHQFRVVDRVTNVEREVSMVARGITTTPVRNVQVMTTATGKVGYLAFHSHVGPAEAALADAVTTLRSEAIVDLIVDLRYNGGGYLVIAQQFASMVAGPARMSKRIFSTLEFNSKHQVLDPYSGDPLAPELFPTTSIGLSASAGTPLPGLDLDRVFVLTGPDTCSASEAFINGLRGVGVEVVQIGEQTCGKPYGFVPKDNCGVTYSSINFRSLNADGWADFGDGFAAGRAAGPAGVMPGCRVADDFLHALGDPREGRLAAALRWRESGACPASSATNTARRARGTTSRAPRRPGQAIALPAWRQGAFRRP